VRGSRPMCGGSKRGIGYSGVRAKRENLHSSVCISLEGAELRRTFPDFRRPPVVPRNEAPTQKSWWLERESPCDRMVLYFFGILKCGIHR
jgi:hypothetical protein